MPRPLDLDPDQRVVVTGLGTVNPSSLRVDNSWRFWTEGRSGLSTASIGYPPDITEEIAGKVKRFDPLRYASRKQVERNPKYSLYSLAASVKAARDAGILEETGVRKSLSFDPEYKLVGVNPDRVRIIIGVAVGGADIAAEVRQIIARTHNFSDLSENTVRHLDPNAASALVGRYVHAEAGAYTPAAACATGALTAELAYDTIRSDRADVVLAGGTESSLVEVAFRGFARWRLLAQDDNPQRSSKPFDKGATGLVIGEGAGVLVYERLTHALKRKAKIYAELLGTNYVSFGSEDLLPKASSEARAMAGAINSAHIPPELIDYISAHAAGSKGDEKELDAAVEVMGEHAYRVPISSLKSMIGHCMGAAGAIESIATVLTVHTGVITPNATLENPSREGFNLPRSSLKLDVIFGLKNSFGLRGAYFSAVYGKYPNWKQALERAS